MRVETDIARGRTAGSLATVRVRASFAGGQMIHESSHDVADPDVAMPGELVLRAVGPDDVRAIDVEVLGLVSGGATIQRFFTVRFSPRQTTLLDAFLAGRCLQGVVCEEGATCGRGGLCEPSLQGSLPAYTPLRTADVADVDATSADVLDTAPDGVGADGVTPDDIPAAEDEAVVFNDVAETLDQGLDDVADVTDAVVADSARDAASADGPRDGAVDGGLTDTGPSDASTCGLPRVSCAASCVDLTTNGANCGACGTRCATATCVAGVCTTPTSGQRSCAVAGTPGCGIVEIAGGTFTMGSTTNCGTAAQNPVTCGYSGAPAKTVTVRSFALDAFEVSVARFRVFMGVRGAALASIHARPIAYPGGRTIAWTATGMDPLTNDPNDHWTATPAALEAHPMNGVDWWMAQEFCVWEGGRLPTEAEWEYAAHGRPVPAEGLVPGRLYPWGDAPPSSGCDRARWNSNGCASEDGVATRRVGSFAATGGLYDLAGNVFEWTADTYAYFSSGPCWNVPTLQDPLCYVDPTTPRVIRGGSWNYQATPVLRCASRTISNPGDRVHGTGIRCARSRP